MKLKNNKTINAGINAKMIHRKAGEFATAWGFGFDARYQILETVGSSASWRAISQPLSMHGLSA